MLDEFSKRTFQSDVLQSELPMIVYFTGVNCRPCKLVTPIVEQLADELGGKLKVGKIDINRNMLTALKYGVLKAPTLLLFIKGQEVERVMGVVPKQVLYKRLEAHFSQH